jgi:hypothetical protein
VVKHSVSPGMIRSATSTWSVFAGRSALYYIDSVLIEIDTLNWVLNEISQYSINGKQLE